MAFPTFIPMPASGGPSLPGSFVFVNPALVTMVERTADGKTNLHFGPAVTKIDDAVESVIALLSGKAA